MRMRRLVLLLLWLLAAPAVVSGQSHLHAGQSGLPHGVPDFCDGRMPSPTLVAAGATLDITADQSYTCLGIHGTVNVADHVAITADVILIYADGTLNIGSQADPAMAVTLTGRDTPLLPSTADPEQFGQGVLVFGTLRVWGDPAQTQEAGRSVVFRSANPSGVRWHLLASQRADVDIRHAEFAHMGRTSATRLLDSAVFAQEGLAHYGTNQIGRYALHLHHVHGPFPTAGSHQGVLINNYIHHDSKWGITLHNTHYFRVEDNIITDGLGSGIVEEDGSETANEYRRNVVRRMFNPVSDAVTGGDASMTPTGRGVCVNSGYDPQARCASGFWFRGTAQAAVQDNVVEDVRVGFGWWPLCLEVNTTYPGSLAQDPQRCAGEWQVTIPLFRGADTSDPAQRQASCYSVYNQAVVGQCMVKDRVRPVGAVSGNRCTRAMACLEHWWDAQVQKGGGPILNTTAVDVRTPIQNFYSDVSFDGFTATKTVYAEPLDTDLSSTVISEFNHGCPAAGHCLGSTATYANFQAQGYLFAWRPAGQLVHPFSRVVRQSTFGTKWGFHIDYGRQGPAPPNRDMHVNDVLFRHWDGSTAQTTFLTGNYNALILDSAEVINVYVDNFNGTTADFRLTHHPGKDPSCTATLLTVQSAASGSDLTPIGLAPICGAVTPPPPVDCVVSAWSEWSAWSAWAPIDATTEQRTRTRTRTVITPPQNGGAACPPLTETETQQRLITEGVCLDTPLVMKKVWWPTSQTGDERGRWDSGSFALVKVTFLWSPQRFEATDTRGCSVQVVK